MEYSLRRSHTTKEDSLLMKSPLLDPLQLNVNIMPAEAGHYQTNAEREESGTGIENELKEKAVKRATIEDIIELLLTGAAAGFSFSASATTRMVEVARLIKWLNVKLMSKVNNQTLRAHFISVASSYSSSVFANSAFIIAIINGAFDFKNRIVIKAINEYTSWVSTKVGGIYAIKEYDPGAVPFITKYWNATSSPLSLVDPWSAAFISWVIKISDALDMFRYSASHFTYIRQARINRRDNIENPFRLYKIHEFIPRMQTGDLVCFARDGSGLTYENILLPHKNTNAHVDIITDIDLPGNRIRVIGGNVCDNVDHKILKIVGTTKIQNSDGHPYFAGIGIGNG